VYIGEFKNGDINGKGTYKTKHGVILEGEFENSKMMKIGTIKINSKTKFCGSFYKNLASGFGKFSIDQMGTLMGYWKSGNLHSLDYRSFKYF
jgi:hypothetical protein